MWLEDEAFAETFANLGGDIADTAYNTNQSINQCISNSISPLRRFFYNSTIDWLIDWFIVGFFFAVSVVLQPCNGGYCQNMAGFEILKFPWRPSRAYSFSISRETVFCMLRGCYPWHGVPSEGQFLFYHRIKIKAGRSFFKRMNYIDLWYHSYMNCRLLQNCSLLRPHAFCRRLIFLL